MQRFLVIGALLGALLLGSAASVVAQDATPEPSPAGGGSVVDPAVGTTVSYIGDDGAEWATVTVEEVIDPFEDYDTDLGGPERGNRIVAVRLTVEATGDKAVEVNTFDFGLQDDQGYYFGSAFLSRTEEQEAADPELEDANLAPGDSVSGLLFFEVFGDAGLAHFFWQPESGRLITLANLSAES